MGAYSVEYDCQIDPQCGTTRHSIYTGAGYGGRLSAVDDGGINSVPEPTTISVLLMLVLALPGVNLLRGRRSDGVTSAAASGPDSLHGSAQAASDQ